MKDFGKFSRRRPQDLWEPPPPSGERASSARLRGFGSHTRPAPSSWTGAPGEGSEATAPRSPLHCSPTPRPRRRRSPLTSPRESRSLRDVTQRPPDRAKKHRTHRQRLDDAWGEPRPQPQPLGSSRHSQAWLPQSRLSAQQHHAPAQGDSPPLYPEGAYTPLSGTVGAERGQSGDPWAVPVCRGLDCWALSSAPTEKSSAPSQVFRTLSACGYTPTRDNSDQGESLASQCFQPSVSSKEMQSQHTQILKNKLEEAVMSSRDQKIVALVLTRLQKAQRMRELQQQAAVAWEELKRWDHKVQTTLERERKLLLQQSQEQWLQKEQRVAHKRDSQAQNMVQQENQWKVPSEVWETQRQEKLGRACPQAGHRRQCQATRLPEGDKMHEYGEQNSLGLQKRLEPAGHKRQVYTAGGQERGQEANLSSRVNYQAQKVLKECQTKAEELLRKLSLEQSFQRSQETQQGLRRACHRELQGKARNDEEQLQQVRWCAEHLAEQRKVHKRLLMELADQKVRQARRNVCENIRDMTQHVRELDVLRGKDHHVLKLQAEKEEKCHVDGIKEAIRRREQSLEPISPEKDTTYHEFPRTSRASRGHHVRVNSIFNQLEGEAQLHASQQRGGF